MRVAFLMCVVNALVIPNPSCWIVVIEGVGAEYEYPKNFLVLCVFQRLSAVFRMATGHGCVVDRENMRRALWHSPRNLYCSGCFEPNRKL